MTKSGGNTFQGEGHYYYIGSGLSAGPGEAAACSIPRDDRTVSYVQDDKQPNNQNEFGGSVGGPIIKDRLFFFGSVLAAARPPDQRLRCSRAAPSLVEIKRDQTLTQAFGKVSVDQPIACNAYGSVLLHADDDHWRSARLRQRRPELPDRPVLRRRFDQHSARLGNEPDERDRQRGHPARIVRVPDRARRLLLRQLQRHGNIPTTTERAPIKRRRSVCRSAFRPTCSCRFRATTPRARRSPTSTRPSVASSISTTPSRSTPCRRALDSRAASAIQHVTNDVDSAYPGGYTYIYWDRAVHQWCHRGRQTAASTATTRSTTSARSARSAATSRRCTSRISGTSRRACR